jgi:multicomponent K+:H+ antiporter subunit D
MTAAWVWAAILLASLGTMIGFARAGSVLFWSRTGDGTPAPQPQPPMAFAAIGALMLALVALTVFAGPVTGWLALVAQDLHSPAAYIAANALGGT